MRKSKSIQTYSMGATFDGRFSLIGMIILTLGFLFLVRYTYMMIEYLIDNNPFNYSAYFVLIGIMFISFVLAVNIKGTLIDRKNRRFKIYRNFLLFKTGKWKPLGGFSMLVLTIYTSERTIARSNYIKSNTTGGSYGIYLTTDYETIILTEFVSYKKAVLYLATQHEILDIPVRNEIALSRKKTRKRKNRRR